jgi:hypothetical protein
MIDAPELRTYVARLELRDAQAVGAGRVYRYLEGRAVPYDEWADLGLFMERHAQRSFLQSTKAGSGKNLPLLMFHDRAAFPVGLAESWKHDDGLTGVWKLADTDEAQRAARGAADGAFGLSIGFQPIRSEVTKQAQSWAPDLGPEHKDWLTRAESRLLEVSLTPVPAFTGAEVTMVRSAYRSDDRPGGPAGTPLLDGWRAELDALRSPEH